MVRLTKAEEPLPGGGSCLLASINLSEFVTGAFTSHATFDFLSFSRAVQIAIRALNDVLDEGLPLHPLPEQRDSVRDWRQCGLGIMGLADMLIKLQIRYGSEDACALCDRIGNVMAQDAIMTSCELAKMFGAYPKCDASQIVKTKFFKNQGCDEREVLEYGLRNSQLLTVAPTGSKTGSV